MNHESNSARTSRDAMTQNEFEALCVLQALNRGACRVEALADRLHLAGEHAGALASYCRQLAQLGYATESPYGLTISPNGAAAVARGRLHAA